MGGSESKTRTNLVTKQIVDIMVQNIMNCSSNTIVNQTFDVTGNYNVVNGFKQVQHMKLSTTCSQDSKSSTDLQQQVADKIKQLSEAEGSGITSAIGGSKAKTDLFIDNEVSIKINPQTVLNIIQNANLQQEARIKGDHNVIQNFSQESTQDIVYSNCQNVLNTLQSVQAIKNDVDQSAHAKTTNPVSDMLDSVFNGMTKLASVWLFIIIGIVAVIVMGGGSLLNPMSWLGLSGSSDWGDTDTSGADTSSMDTSGADTSSVDTNDIV
jgi:hypothetical protein